ncbi:hypothetical protein ST47_g4743 [Ascochyta rabiei]|uniref:Uncharacterized protein n=1 Tax=Didymella rabiei TaxID=5454 RepID=A0A163F303_DIDRA|nr:hypothetical protein ST47_g4743 [Ascochyta rabiei]
MASPSTPPAIIGALMKIPAGLDLEMQSSQQADTETANFDPGSIFGIMGGSALSQTFNQLIPWLPLGSGIPIIAQVAVRATAIAANFAPIWFVNFPPALSGAEQSLLREYMKEILDFRSWSSLKWWADAFGNVPSSGEGAAIMMQQSSEFARMAFRDLVQMPWLRATREPTSYKDAFDCHINDLHGNLIKRTMSSWGSLENDTLLALEPVLQRVLASVNTGEAMSSSTQVRSVLSERYEYQDNNRTFKSYLRLVCFEVAEAVRDVVDGKNSSHRQVECQMSYMYYEAEFDMNRWKTFSETINDQQRSACREFVMHQTVDM